jgi:hypothetical protein
MSFLANFSQTKGRCLLPTSMSYRKLTPLDERNQQPDGFCMEVCFREDGFFEQHDVPLIPKTHRICKCKQNHTKPTLPPIVKGNVLKQNAQSAQWRRKEKDAKSTQPKHKHVISRELANPFSLIKNEICEVYRDLKFCRCEGKAKKRANKEAASKLEKNRLSTVAAKKK